MFDKKQFTYINKILFNEDLTAISVQSGVRKNFQDHTFTSMWCHYSIKI
jgi:hypothetical protein